MDKRCFVRIEVPTVDHSGRDQGGTGGASGTGYPVGESLILTARHVVRPGKERDRRYPIRVRWYSFPDCGEHSDGVVELDDDEEAIVWEGDGNIDIALLHCPHRPEPVEPGCFLPRLPNDHDRWESIGFPRATRFDEGRTQNPFFGEILVPHEPWFQICEKYPPTEAEDWMGASGMPIFVEARIIGVFSASLGRIQGKGLALPIQPLLDSDTEFCKRVGYDNRWETEWHAYRETVVRDVAGYLEGVPDVCDALLDLVDCPAARKSKQDASELLSRTLLDMQFTEFTALASNLYRKLRAPGAREGNEVTAKAIFRISHRLAPALYDPGVVRIACEQRDRVALIELPAAMHTVAELAVAASERRAAELRPRRDAMDEDPLGARALPAAVPELGIEVTSDTVSAKIEDHLVRKQMLGSRFDGRAFLRDIDDYLDDTFYPSGRLDRDPGESAEERRDRWNGIDRALVRRGREGRFYLVFRPVDEAELKTMKETAKILKDRFEHLLILFLVAYRDDSGDNPWDREADQVYDFCQMLPIRGTSTP